MAESIRRREFSLLSLACIFALKSLPDSTLSIAGSSWGVRVSLMSSRLGPDPVLGRAVGAEGRLQKSGLSIEKREDPKPHVAPPPIFICPICKPRMGETSSPIKLKLPSQLGDVGSESDGEPPKGEVKIDVGEETNELPPAYESKSKR